MKHPRGEATHAYRSPLFIRVPGFDDGVYQVVGRTQTLYQSQFIFRNGCD